MSRLSPFLVSILLLLGTACSEQGDSLTPDAVASGAPSHAHDSAADPLPLLPIMLQMAGDMSGLMQALWLEDYERMSAHAAALAGHASISAEERARIEAELGPEMAAFVAADEAVHHASERLHEAAEARDMNVVLDQLAEVQRGCVDCHILFQARLSTRKSTDR